MTLANLDPYRYITAEDRYFMTDAQIEAKAAAQKAKDDAAAAKEREAYQAQKAASNSSKKSTTTDSTKNTNVGYSTSSGSSNNKAQWGYTSDNTTKVLTGNSPDKNMWNSDRMDDVKNAGLESALGNALASSAAGVVAGILGKDNEKSTTTDHTKNNNIGYSTSNKSNSEETPIDNAVASAVLGGILGTGVLDSAIKSDNSSDAGNDNGGTDGGSSSPSYSGGGGSSSTPSTPSSGYYNGANWSGGTSYKPYPTAEEMAQYVSTIIQAAKGELGDVVKPEYMEAEKPGAVTLRTLEDLAETYGITYDYDSIYKLFNDSVEKQYEAIYAKQRQNEDAYYDNAVAAQNTLLDTLSRDRSSAVQAGVSRGMQAANALGAMLGVSQQFANNATTLSQERSNTAKEYGADLAQAMVDAEATSNERKNAIMEIAKMLYGYDSEQYVANMDNYNTILTNNAALQQTYMNNNASLQNALASIFGNVAANKITGDANVQSSTLAAEAQKAAAQYAAEAQRYVAEQSYLSNLAIAEANKYAADINKEIYGTKEDTLGDNEIDTAGTGTGTGTGTGMGTTTTNKGTTQNFAGKISSGIQSDIHSVTWVLEDMINNLRDSFGLPKTSNPYYK